MACYRQHRVDLQSGTYLEIHFITGCHTHHDLRTTIVMKEMTMQLATGPCRNQLYGPLPRYEMRVNHLPMPMIPSYSGKVHKRGESPNADDIELLIRWYKYDLQLENCQAARLPERM